MRDTRAGGRLPVVCSPVARASFVGIVAAFAWFLLTSHLGLDLDDEGYYWYGSQRAALGEIPIRDFQSYDVGRYVFTALVFRLIGDDGVVASRVAADALFVPVVAIVYYLAWTATVDVPRRARVALVILSCALAAAWTYPSYKAFDVAAPLVLMIALRAVFLASTPIRWLALGVAVGVLGLIGRNHGAYALVASVLAVVVLRAKARQPAMPLARCAAAWIAGVAIGYAPVLAMLAVVPGFANANVRWLDEMLRAGATNYPLPIPWPWQGTLDIATDGVFYTAHRLALGACVTLLVVGPVLASVSLARVRSFGEREATLASALCAAIPYAHYAASRSDAMHLVVASVLWLAVAPMLLASQRPAARPYLAALLMAFAFALLLEAPSVRYALSGREQWSTIAVGADRLRVDPATARAWDRRIAILREFDAREDFLALPDMPTLHAALHVAMPVHDIYVTAPTADDLEDSEIERMAAARPRIILVSDKAIDGLDRRRFSRMRSRTFAWITTNYRRVEPARAREEEDLLVFSAR